ncbi:MAG TPA: hypothetical protein VGE45_18645 [Chloroflexia bacterium]|jgi:hypothetical protein
MQVDSLSRVDIRAFVAIQGRERFKAFIIHGHPLCGKTAFAQKLASVVEGAAYLDLLQYVTERHDLTSSIDTLDVPALQDLVIEYAGQAEATLLLVDDLDFLLHVWGDGLSEFKGMVETLSVTQTPTTIAFIMQTHPELEEWPLQNTRRQSCVLKLEEIIAI